MKKTYLLLSLFVALCISSYAAVVPVTTAKTVGYNYLLQHGTPSLTNENDLSLVYTAGSAPAYFYVFSGASSFVIVSAEDGVVPVLGYSKQDAFHGDHVPATVLGFFESYTKQISYVIANQVTASEDIATSWDHLVHNVADGAAHKTTTVPPLLTTTWSQDPYYNADCPYDAAGGGLSVTGCVATATAQVMKYWNWPVQGTGTHSYSTSSYGTLSANFGATTYNWSAMPNNVTGANAAVATLMYHVGVSVDMDYSAAESGAYVISGASPVINCSEYALKTYFNYKPTMQGLERSSYSDASWLSMIEAEMNAARPVIYAGFGSAGGHCFVIDGYDASDYFHVNWGWAGQAPNGYYYMDALNPPALGTGGGAGGFNSDQQAIIGIQPNGAVSTSSLELYDYMNVSQTGIQYTDTFSVYTNVYNSGTTTFNGDFCFAAFDASTGNLVTLLDSFQSMSLPAGNVYNAPGLGFTNVSSVAMIPGTYNISILYRSTGGTWNYLPNGGGGLYTNATQITVYNHNFIETFTNITPSPSPLVQGTAATVSVTIYNGDVAAWTDSLYMGLYNMDGSFNSDINVIAGTSLASGTSSGVLNFSTSSITANPGTYLLVLWFKYNGAWYLCGADYAQNPVTVNVIAPPPPPDMYEVNNTAATAYNLSSTLSWASNTAHTSTPGSTIHINSDQDYYKVVLPAGYSYSINARVNDVVSKDDAATYTADVLWSYSKDGGATWSATYNNTMTGNISIPNLTGGTVIFHVAPASAGSTGSYLLKLGTITRATSVTAVPDVHLDATAIYPNPAISFITVDLANTGAKGTEVTFTDVTGKKVLTVDIRDQALATVSLSTLQPGVYLMLVSTNAGVISKKITVAK